MPSRRPENHACCPVRYTWQEGGESRQNGGTKPPTGSVGVNDKGSWCAKNKKTGGVIDTDSNSDSDDEEGVVRDSGRQAIDRTLLASDPPKPLPQSPNQSCMKSKVYHLRVVHQIYRFHPLLTRKKTLSFLSQRNLSLWNKMINNNYY